MVRRSMSGVMCASRFALNVDVSLSLWVAVHEEYGRLVHVIRNSWTTRY